MKESTGNRLPGFIVKNSLYENKEKYIATIYTPEQKGFNVTIGPAGFISKPESSFWPTCPCVICYCFPNSKCFCACCD